MDENDIPIARPVSQDQPNPQPKAFGGASTRAITALILGALSILCTGFLTGIPAIVLGIMEGRAIREGKSPKEGETMAKVGYILGIVGTVLTCLVILAVIAVVILGITMNGGAGLVESLKTT